MDTKLYYDSLYNEKNDEIILFITKIGDYKKIIQDIIKNHKNCILPGVGDYLENLNLKDFEYENKKFINVGGDAVLVNKNMTLEEFIKKRGW